MSNKHTYCPSCMTTYKVTVAQLTVAQGLVCCPKCNTSFNALSHLVTEKKATAPTVTKTAAESRRSVESNSSTPTTQLENSALHHHLLDIFDLKIENSNIDLKTYLNNLNYFSTEPIGTLPAVNWTDQEETKKHGIMYYFAWTIFNSVLIGTLVFQFFWFNPHYLKNSPLMSKSFNAVCELFQCSNLQEHYNLITINKVKVQALGKNQTQFRGELLNFHDRSLALPILVVNLKEDNVIISSYKLNAAEYLIPSLVSIQRIPQNSPFAFEFVLPVEQKSFNHYDFQIIQP